MVTLTEIPDNPADSAPVFVEPNLVVVEGRHDQQLIYALLLHLGLDRFQVHSVHGTGKWHGKVVAITKDDTFAENVERMALIRDADTNGQAAWQSCTSALNASGLGIPSAPGELGEECENGIRAVVLIVPGRDATGAVEELIMPALNPERMACVEQYRICLDEKAQSYATGGKAILRTYLSGLPDYVHDTRAALTGGHVNFEHPSLEPVRDLLTSMSRR